VSPVDARRRAINNGSLGLVDSVRCAGMRSPSDKGTWRAERREAAGVATSGSSAHIPLLGVGSAEARSRGCEEHDHR
jgi:hypothetical protein